MSIFHRRRFPAPLRRLGLALIAVVGVLHLTPLPATADAPTDNLHGGQGVGVKVTGHLDLGDLTGHVSVLDGHAYVGVGTNGGFAAQWNKTAKCSDPSDTSTPAPSVKVVSLAGPNPTLVTTIPIGAPGAESATIARDVATLRVSAVGSTVARDLLAVALESCKRDEGLVGVNFYDVTNPAQPILLSHDDRFVGNTATRDVSLVQRADGRVFALEANQGGLGGGIFVVDITVPTTPVTVGQLSQSNFSSVSNPPLECRPFSFAQGATPNAAGTKAYGAYSDEGLFVLDISNPNPAVELTGTQRKHDADEEGNSFSFVPNGDESRALATAEDLLPAKTTLTVSTGSASTVTEPGQTTPGVFRGCEALWGAPLYRQATPSVTSTVEYALTGCKTSEYSGRDVAGKIVVVDRGGSLDDGRICRFDDKGRVAQDPNNDGDRSDGAAAVLVANTGTDHHGTGTNFLFSPDTVVPGDAGVFIPVVTITREARDAIFEARITNGETVSATLADNADTWGAVRILDPASTAPPTVFNAPHTTVLTPGDGLYHAVNGIWGGSADKQALVAWMSDGLRVVDASVVTAPKARAYYVPPAAIDNTGQYGTVPLVVGVARHGSQVVITDINGGLYVLNVVLNKADCMDGGHVNYGFANQGACTNLFDDDTL